MWSLYFRSLLKIRRQNYFRQRAVDHSERENLVSEVHRRPIYRADGFEKETNSEETGNTLRHKNFPGTDGLTEDFLETETEREKVLNSFSLDLQDVVTFTRTEEKSYYLMTYQAQIIYQT